MKTTIFAAGLLAVCCSASAQVSISVGQPGFYGRLDLGGMAPPPVVYREPILVERPVRVIEEPVYLRVPPGHQKNWRRHCGRYHACDRRVYFVRDNWYLNDFAPRYRSHQMAPRPHGPRHDDRGHGRPPHHDRGPDRHDRGHDRGHERGHDRGHGGGHDRDHGGGHDRGHGR